MNVRSALAVGVATLGLTFGGLFGFGSTPQAEAASSAYCGTSTVNGVTTKTPCNSTQPTTVTTNCQIVVLWGIPFKWCT